MSFANIGLIGGLTGGLTTRLTFEPCHSNQVRDFVGVLEAVLWGLGAGSSLLLGAGAVLAWPRLAKPRTVGLIMGFGAGTLISAVSLELALDGYHVGGPGAVGAGLLVGATGY